MSSQSIVLKPTIVELEVVEIAKILIGVLAYLEIRCWVHTICNAEVGLAVPSKLTFWYGLRKIYLDRTSSVHMSLAIGPYAAAVEKGLQLHFMQ